MKAEENLRHRAVKTPFPRKAERGPEPGFSGSKSRAVSTVLLCHHGVEDLFQ